MSDTLTPAFVPAPTFAPSMPTSAPVATTNVIVAVGGKVHFTFDPATPTATTVSSLDPDAAAATEAVLEEALAKARAITQAFKGLASQ